MDIYITARNYFHAGGTLDYSTKADRKTYGWGEKAGGDWTKRRNATTISPNGRRIALDIDDIV
ncbi:hypothetical protein FACS1894125_7420 [Actinomycetota bacterium]|nr:hypothetical protein FACS1894125_7420 [Actinomycetota bacterium]